MGNEYNHLQLVTNTVEFKMISKMLPSVALMYKQPYQRKMTSSLSHSTTIYAFCMFQLLKLCVNKSTLSKFYILFI